MRRSRILPWFASVRVQCSQETFRRQKNPDRRCCRQFGEAACSQSNENAENFLSARRNPHVGILPLWGGKRFLLDLRFDRGGHPMRSMSAASTSSATDRAIKSTDRTTRQEFFLRTRMPVIPPSGP